jgi:hypothetical protein
MTFAVLWQEKHRTSPQRMANHRRSIRRDFEKKAKIVEMRANSAKIRAILFPLIEKCASEGIIYSSSRHRTSHIFRAVKEKFMSCRKRTNFQATQNFSFNSISRLLWLCKKFQFVCWKSFFFISLHAHLLGTSTAYAPMRQKQLLEFLELDLIRGITQDGSSTNQAGSEDHQEVVDEWSGNANELYYFCWINFGEKSSSLECCRNQKLI